LTQQRPRIEARVSAQERRQIYLDARIEELSEDMAKNFKTIEEKIDHIEAEMVAMEERILDAFQQLAGSITHGKEA
jgi:chaperonin cofactor prefoldin